MDILAFRLAEEVPLIISNLFLMVPLVLAIFLFGLYVGKKGVLKDIEGHLPWVRKIWVRSLIFGWGLTAIYV
ncbi:hypothetical protein, partial [Pseudomonas sp. 2822-15]|uniref:hypothetical protein n=1 Tax=Pseudomonas sp. 2822-15 TaxID=1712677 RepID=UPI001C487CBF